MKKKIWSVLILMSACVAGITGLQLFWNFQNYQHTVKAFDHDINEALQKAVDREADRRREGMVKQFKSWLADTSLIIITADHKNRDSSTVFRTRDAHPRYQEDLKRPFTFGLSEFKQRLDHITPEAKKLLIEHFGNSMVKRDLEKGIVYNYTQMLGDSLGAVFNHSKVDMATLSRLYQQELSARKIDAKFRFSHNKQLFLTRPVNTDLRKPYKKHFVTAGFERPGIYFLRVMKWVIITSLLLILVMLGCFYYTVRTLLSQAQLVTLKDDLIHNMTHELNTPLASIKITAEALKSYQLNEATRSEYLDIIAYQADKLSGLAAQVLQEQRPEHAKVPVNLADLVDQALKELAPRIRESGAHIQWEPNKLIVKADPAAILTAISNILDNALKYSSEIPQISISLSQVQGMAELRIADQGIGIPEMYREQIFEQFFRVPQGDRHDVKGYGLGLSLVRKLIRAHQGTVSYEPNQPSGSTFIIRLPL